MVLPDQRQRQSHHPLHLHLQQKAAIYSLQLILLALSMINLSTMRETRGKIRQKRKRFVSDFILCMRLCTLNRKYLLMLVCGRGLWARCRPQSDRHPTSVNTASLCQYRLRHHLCRLKPLFGTRHNGSCPGLEGYVL